MVDTLMAALVGRVARFHKLMEARMSCGRCGKRGLVIARTVEEASKQGAAVTAKRLGVVARSIAVDARKLATRLVPPRGR